MQANLLRDKFLDFFKSNKHKIIESDSLVPQDDPTVLFTPAGMNQFKKEFLGFDSGFKRAATAQRCLRTDDLDKVGKTSSHHTFFEMLGNFSFGDYFKKEAIGLAWEFLTEELKIKKDRLWVSVYKDDDEAYGAWKDLIKVPENKIIKLGDKDNFWPAEAKEKGPNGPCGPCSEIFFDQGVNPECKSPDCNPACSCGRFVEVWNLVFTQFNRREGGALEPLPNKNIDTGMGLERLAALMQGAPNNFETDLFQPIIKEIKQGQSPSGTVPAKELLYAVSDHIRAIVFAIYDGVLPSNEARGYVARKLIRKSTLHLRVLGFKQPFLYKLVPLVSNIMKKPYPQLDGRKENIAEIILAEEKNFISTLDSSETLFKDKFRDLLKKGDPKRAGQIAFQLYDTYGIPLELTEDWLDKYGIKIAQEVFNAELDEQKTRSKLQSSMKGDVFDAKGLGIDLKETKFLGYKDCSVKARIIKIIKGDSEVSKVTNGDACQIILDQTAFYPEGGGQVGDKGKIVQGKNTFEVLDTKKIGKAIVHIGCVKEGAFKKSGLVSAKIDNERRLSIARNHTATHLLQAALREVLGGHVKQQGSLVAEEKLRFDFTHFKDVSEDELNRIEEIVNSYVVNNYKLQIKQLSLSEAKEEGALAFFGEKYGARVRVISINDISKELCAGTHLDSTGSIGVFKIIQEGSIASGIRRIEALTGRFAYKVIKEEEKVIVDIASDLGVSKDRVAEELKNRLARVKELEKALAAQKLGLVKDSVEMLIEGAEKIKDISVITQMIDHSDMDLLRKTVDLIKEKVDNTIIALGTKSQGRALLVMGATKGLTEKGIDVRELIKKPAEVLGGSGGGRLDFAQAGGSKPENFSQAFEELKNIIKGRIQ